MNTVRKNEYRVSPDPDDDSQSKANAPVRGRDPLFSLSHCADCSNAKEHRKPTTPNDTPSDMTVDMRDYPATMDRSGLVAVSSSLDEARRVTVTARPDTDVVIVADVWIEPDTRG